LARQPELRHTGAVAALKSDPDLPKRDGDVLVETYMARRAGLIRFFAARVPTQAAAEDLVQDLYLKLATRPLGVEAENPAALLYRIALNLLRDRARGESRAAARDADWRGAHHASVAGEDVADEAPADEVAASRQRLRRLVEAVAELPPQMRRAFTLHKLDGLSHAETARTMGLSVKSVEKHVSAALGRLAAGLAK
jgi:RNA polymerase sigma-70 factor (ECF subfamily)